MFLFEWNKEVLGSTWGVSHKNSFVCSFVIDVWHLCFHLNGIKYLTCGALHKNLFVWIHVWHPCFHLNGIKKYLAQLVAWCTRICNSCVAPVFSFEWNTEVLGTHCINYVPTITITSSIYSILDSQTLRQRERQDTKTERKTRHRQTDRQTGVIMSTATFSFLSFIVSCTSFFFCFIFIFLGWFL